MANLLSSACRTLVLGLALLPGAGQAADGVAAPALSPALQRAVAPLTVGDTRSTLPEGWHKGAFAEIFVRGYRDSNGDGIGDLRGVIQSLDYLSNLGVRGIWLMPISPSQDHDHGYSVSDYRHIEPAYGTGCRRGRVDRPWQRSPCTYAARTIGAGVDRISRRAVNT